MRSSDYNHLVISLFLIPFVDFLPIIIQNTLELRTQIMSASLLSDMESFKAANPNGKLEDFIRWYSPRDWIEDAKTVDGKRARNENSTERK